MLEPQGIENRLGSSLILAEIHVRNAKIEPEAAVLENQCHPRHSSESLQSSDKTGMQRQSLMVILYSFVRSSAVRKGCAETVVQ